MSGIWQTTLPRDLYFILNPCTRLVKIGVARDPVARIFELQRMGGVPLRLLGALKEGAGYEERLHLLFADSRHIGEWFDSTDEILSLAANPHQVPVFIQANQPRLRKARARFLDARKQAGSKWRGVTLRAGT